MSGGRISFQVDELVVDVDLSAAQAARLTPVLQAAVEELARRLQDGAAARFRKPARFVLAELAVDALSADELLGPRGATRLADAFLSQLLRRGALS